MEKPILEILKMVCEHQGLPMEKVLNKTRKREYVFCRQLAMTICYNARIESLAEIGSIIGGKDHATVLHAKKTIGNLCDTDRKIDKLYCELITKSRNILSRYNLDKRSIEYVWSKYLEVHKEMKKYRNLVRKRYKKLILTKI